MTSRQGETQPQDTSGEGRPGAGYWYAKRVLDITLILLSAPVLGLVLLICMAAIKVSTPGPVIFKQRRVGSRRLPTGDWEIGEFTLYKLRTMYHGSDQTLHRDYMDAYIAGDEGHMSEVRGVEGTYKMLADPRITPVGRFLRKLSLDELPQLWNVIKGDMSLVGPRPAIPYEVAKYEASQKSRLACLPGLTGWWQVNGRGDLSFEQMIELDLYYVDHQSVLLDMLILAKTVPVALLGKGAG